jgi:hypothetical protein
VNAHAVNAHAVARGGFTRPEESGKSRPEE